MNNEQKHGCESKVQRPKLESLTSILNKHPDILEKINRERAQRRREWQQQVFTQLVEQNGIKDDIAAYAATTSLNKDIAERKSIAITRLFNDVYQASLK